MFLFPWNSCGNDRFGLEIEFLLSLGPLSAKWLSLLPSPDLLSLLTSPDLLSLLDSPVLLVRLLSPQRLSLVLMGRLSLLGEPCSPSRLPRRDKLSLDPRFSSLNNTILWRDGFLIFSRSIYICIFKFTISLPLSKIFFLGNTNWRDKLFFRKYGK